MHERFKVYYKTGLAFDLSEGRPEKEGIYEYSAYRGPGHLVFASELHHNGTVTIELKSENLSFDVRRPSIDELIKAAESEELKLYGVTQNELINRLKDHKEGEYLGFQALYVSNINTLE